MATKPKTRSNLTFVDVDDDALVYDPRDHDIHYLNPTGKLVFQLCDGTTTLEETAAGIAAAFGADPAGVETDVRTAAAELERLGLLEAEGETAAADAVSTGRETVDKDGAVRVECLSGG